MRTVIAAVVAAAVAGLAVAADAAPASKKKQRSVGDQERTQESGARQRNPRFGYDSSPEHFRVGTSEWWQAMEREGRGGFGDTP